jgi:hypothetical protein
VASSSGRIAIPFPVALALMMGKGQLLKAFLHQILVPAGDASGA